MKLNGSVQSMSRKVTMPRAARRNPVAPADNKLRPLGAYSQGKVEQILAAAKALFTEHGFSATSMDAVADLAKVGKATVYAHFKSKDELFRAVINSEAVEPLNVLKVPTGADFHVTLRQFADEAFDLVLSPTNIAAFRTVAAEANRSPNLGKDFYENGPVTIINALAKFLANGMERGHIRPGDSRLAATQFLALLCSDLQVRALLGQGTEISPALKEFIVTEAVRAFYYGYHTV